MADKIVGMEVGDPARGIPVKYVDQGDGTFALKVATTGGGGGGGAVTVADGADVAQGTTTDAAAASDSAAGTVLAFLKRISARITALIAVFSPATSVTSTAAEAGHILKAAPGTLYTAAIYNNGSVTQWYQLHDSAAAPTGGAVPKMTLKLAPGGTGNFDYGQRGRAFATGIYITNSTTALTYTAGAADSFYDAAIG